MKVRTVLLLALACLAQGCKYEIEPNMWDASKLTKTFVGFLAKAEVLVIMKHGDQLLDWVGLIYGENGRAVLVAGRGGAERYDFAARWVDLQADEQG